MRKLLSLLTVLTLTVSVPLNVIACGNKANPTPNPDSENPIDIVEILKKTQNKIASLFSDTFYINGKNNLKPTYFASEGDKLLHRILIMLMLVN